MSAGEIYRENGERLIYPVYVNFNRDYRQSNNLQFVPVVKCKEIVFSRSLTSSTLVCGH